MNEVLSSIICECESETDTSRYARIGKILETIEHTDFSKAGLTHDWRNHVPQVLQDHWTELSLETHAAIYIMACRQADREEWD